LFADLPEALRQRVDNNRRPPHANDIVCLIKKYISDDGLAQEPLLVMPDALAHNFNMVPRGLGFGEMTPYRSTQSTTL
jgi:hypothetical protein